MSIAQRRPRGVLGGSVIVAVGATFLLQALNVRASGSYIFITLGLAFLAAYIIGARQYVYLVPAATLLAFGVGLLLPVWYPPMDPQLAGPMLLGSQAVGFLVVWAMERKHVWLLFPAAILAVVAIAEAVARQPIITPAAQPFFVPVMLIGVGAYLLKS